MLGSVTAFNMDTGVSLMLTHLYPRVSTLEDAVKELTMAAPSSQSFCSSKDASTYLTCRRALVACDDVRQLERFAGVHGSLHSYETRQRKVERKNPFLVLKAVVDAVKNVSLCVITVQSSLAS